MSTYWSTTSKRDKIQNLEKLFPELRIFIEEKKKQKCL